MKICFLIRSLGLGGAERQLVNLATGLASRGWQISVAVMYPGGVLEEELRQAGIEVYSVEKRNRLQTGRVVFKLWRWLRRERPDVLHSYLTVCNILSGIIGTLMPSLNVVWGVRASKLPLDAYDWLIGLTERASAFFARRADLIIVNSEAGKRDCLKSGYPSGKTIVIPNGIDTRCFAPDHSARTRMRALLKVGADERLIGLVARLDPVKGHSLFLHAASRLANTHENARFLCVGDGSESVRNELQALARRLGIGNRISWLAAGQDMPAVYNALDILCCSSLSESFPNVLGEGMACGTPCVTTAVGDAERLVGNTGEVAASADPESMCAAWETMLGRIARDGARLGMQCRERVSQCYTHEHLVDRTAEALTELVAPRSPLPSDTRPLT